MNGLSPPLKIWEREFGAGRSRIGLARALSDVDHVDLLDMDAQGAEASFLASQEDVDAFVSKVYRAHIEGHPMRGDKVRGTTDRVVETLLRHGFRIVRNSSSMYSEYRSGTFGRLLARGSTVYAVNPRFRRC